VIRRFAKSRSREFLLCIADYAALSRLKPALHKNSIFAEARTLVRALKRPFLRPN
jgi:hypothetical protein